MLKGSNDVTMASKGSWRFAESKGEHWQFHFEGLARPAVVPQIIRRVIETGGVSKYQPAFPQDR